MYHITDTISYLIQARYLLFFFFVGIAYLIFFVGITLDDMINTYNQYRHVPPMQRNVIFTILCHYIPTSSKHTCIYTFSFAFRLVGNLLVVNLFSTLILIPLICMDIIPLGLWPRMQTSLNHPIRCLLSEFVSSWVSNASMVGTLLIGLDQYLAVMFPLR